jgi:hypothetical protein
MTYFWLSVLILAALLFWPASKLVWVMSVRRLQRKTARELTQEEIDGQLNRARFIAMFLVLIFSFLFNLSMMGGMGRG